MEPALPLGFATVDLDRERRQGLPEIIYAPGKQPDEIARIAGAPLARSAGPVLVTRLDPARTAPPGHPGRRQPDRDLPARRAAFRRDLVLGHRRRRGRRRLEHRVAPIPGGFDTPT